MTAAKNRTFVYHALTTILILMGSVAALAQSGSDRCDASLLPQITVYTERISENLAYLALIDETNYEQERKGGKLGIILDGLPINASYDQFSEHRRAYASRHQVNYTREEARALFRQQLSPEQLKAWTTCMSGKFPGVRIVMRDDDKDGVFAEVRYTEAPGRSKDFTASVVGGTIVGKSDAAISNLWGLLDGDGSSIDFELNHDGGKGIQLKRASPTSTIKLLVDGEDFTDAAVSRWPKPKAVVPPPPKFPVYVTNRMITSCVTRMEPVLAPPVCGHKEVTLSGNFHDLGVIRTQPGANTHGQSHATFNVVPGARRLLFTVGNPYRGDDCTKDRTKQPMLMYVYVDGKSVWETPLTKDANGFGQTFSGVIPLSKSARTITLVGNTGDGPVDCDDSAWANVRFDE